MNKHPDEKPVIEISRRKFLSSAAGGSAILASAATIPIEALTLEKLDKPKTKDPFEEILHRCGSEFGDIRKSS